MDLSPPERKILTLLDGEPVDNFSEWAAEILSITFDEVEIILEKLVEAELVSVAPDEEDGTLCYFHADVPDELLDKELLKKVKE